MDDYGSRIFDDEARPPTNLWTEIFHINSALIANTCRVNSGGFGAVDSSAVAALGDT